MAKICLPELMGKAEGSSKLQQKGVFSPSARKCACSSSPAAEGGQGQSGEPAQPAVSGGKLTQRAGAAAALLPPFSYGTVGQGLRHGEMPGNRMMLRPLFGYNLLEEEIL